MARNVLTGVLALGWMLWLAHVVRYRGLVRTTTGLIEQNTRLIEANESLRWQNSSLLAERDRRARAEAAARARAHHPAPDPTPDAVIDLTDAAAEDPLPHDEGRGGV
jgi:hypothetical protein